MSSVTIRRTFMVNGVLTDVTSMTLTNPAGTKGVVRNDTGASVVAPGTAMVKTSTGTYEKDFTEPVAGLTYTSYVRAVYNGVNYDDERTVEGTSGSIVTAAEVLAELGITAPTTAESTVVANAIIKAEGAVRLFLQYDPLYGAHTEYHPQQPFQAQISRGIWEVMEQRAVLRQVSEAATNELQLGHVPVRGSPSVWRDYNGRSGMATGAFPDSSLLTIGTDFWPNYDRFDSASNPVCVDGILRTIGLWPTTPGTVKVTYNAGYSSAELRGSDRTIDASPIWDACLEEAVRRARRVLVTSKGKVGVKPGVFSSERLGDYSYSLDGATTARLFGGAILPENREKLFPFICIGSMLGA